MKSPTELFPSMHAPEEAKVLELREKLLDVCDVIDKAWEETPEKALAHIDVDSGDLGGYLVALLGFRYNFPMLEVVESLMRLRYRHKTELIFLWNGKEKVIMVECVRPEPGTTQSNISLDFRTVEEVQQMKKLTALTGVCDCPECLALRAEAAAEEKPEEQLPEMTELNSLFMGKEGKAS